MSQKHLDPNQGLPEDSPNESPGSLMDSQGGKANGVKRLTRFPLVIVGVLALLVVGAISYTMMQRQQAQVAGGSRAPIEPPSVSSPARAPIHPPAQTDWMMPTPQIVEIDAEEDPDQDDDEDQDVAQIPSTAIPMDQGTTTEYVQPSPRMEARLALIDRIEQDRLTATQQALTAEATVGSFSQVGQGNSNMPGGGNPMMAGANGMGLPGGMPGSPPSSAEGYGGGGGMGGFGGVPGMGGYDDGSADQERNQAFLRGTTDSDIYLSHTRTAPISDKEVKAGSIIPGVMIGGINSDLPGQIVAQIRENVYDSSTGQHLLIPAGARLVGTYESHIARGQDRVLTAWQRIIYPDGSSLSLDMMPGADASGYSGFSDRVNNHYVRTFTNAFMLSLFSAGIQLSQPDSRGDDGYDSQQVLAAEIGRQLGQVGIEMIRRDMNIQPTIEIRPGYRFNIMVTKDMILPTWDGHPLAAGQ